MPSGPQSRRCSATACAGSHEKVTDMNDLRWALVTEDPALLGDLEPLIQARRRVGSVQLCGSLKEALEAADCVLSVGGEVPQSAVIAARDGRRIPIGWVGAERDA